MTGFTLSRQLSSTTIALALREDVLKGLGAEPKWLPPRWFYDDRGSELFEQITQLPEYYPTRVERSILERAAGEVAAAVGAKTLIELGSGSSVKSRLLIEALRGGAAAPGTLDTYIPIDVSESALDQAGRALVADYPGLTVHALVADFQSGFDLPAAPGPRLVAFLGGTIGNLLPAERSAFFARLRGVLRPGDALLLGTDLVKDERTLIAAYDDPAGVTAAFNKNVLAVLDRELGADLDPDDFDHVALWDPQEEWIEMRLRARRPVAAVIPALDLGIGFAVGEDLRTEISAKFRQDGVRGELAAAGLELTRWWTDVQTRFALSLAVRRH